MRAARPGNNRNRRKRGAIVIDSSSSSDDGNGAGASDAALSATIDSIPAVPSGLAPPPPPPPLSLQPSIATEAVMPHSFSSSAKVAGKVAEDQQKSSSVWGYIPDSVVPDSGNAFKPIIGGLSLPLYASTSVDSGDSMLDASRAGVGAFHASVDREARNQYQDMKVQESRAHSLTFAGKEIVQGSGSCGCGSQYRRRDASAGNNTKGVKMSGAASASGGGAASGGGHASTMAGSYPLGVVSDAQKRSIETGISANGHNIMTSCTGRVHSNSAGKGLLGGGLPDGLEAAGKAENLLKVIIRLLPFRQP